MTHATVTSSAAPLGLAKSKIQSLASIALGASMIFIIGFSHIGAVHNAAHDARHSFAYPCH